MLGVLLAPYWLALLAPGFGAGPRRCADGAADALAVSVSVLVSLVALLGGFLNALRHFLAPALAPVLLNLAMIGCAVALVPLLAAPVYALVWPACCSAACCSSPCKSVPLARRGISLAPLWEPRHPAVRRVLRLLAPSAVGAAVYQINVMLSTSLASVLPAGSVSALWYAGRVFEFPIGLVAVAIGTAALPSFAEQAARGAMPSCGAASASRWRSTNVLAVPASLALLVLARPITAVLFQRGAFGGR